MNKEDLRTLLNQPYQFENWKNVVGFVFPNVSYLQQPLDIPTDEELVESFRQIGSVRLNDGKNLALFEVHVKQNVNIARNRVALRNLVAKYIDQERNHGVLAVYEKGTDEYRFTYTAKETDYDEEKGSFVQKETETKRFTYILGANESCRTARDRFWELSQHKEEATIKDVENAFSVEKLSKEFFTKYKIQYTAFVDYLCHSKFRISAFNADEKAIRDFVKKMLGRIVFLHFVQKKGWLGASNTDYFDGDKQFMANFWEKSGKDKDFYAVHLTSLFFDALNQNHRPNDGYKMPDDKILCIPFLGGGLFEKDREDPQWLTFPSALFEGLFSFFGEYNFTIDENDPHENEVGIDPEMLGQIFENLLEDNKDKGAFYTPKPIVKYMCQESLIQYLLTAFEKEGVITNEPEKQELEEKLGRLVKKYEAGDLIHYDRVLAKALYAVKICDPAIGSGAFPMGILNEMVMLINVLHYASPDVVEDLWKMDNWQPATVKKHIIQNSIYGVDIEKGAVDIARLRFWLSLIIDEEKPCNLPSLDYKIVVGDSLISKFEDEVIDIDWNLSNNPAFRQSRPDLLHKYEVSIFEIVSKQKRYFEADNADKIKLNLEIREAKIDLLQIFVEYQRQRVLEMGIQPEFAMNKKELVVISERQTRFNDLKTILNKLKRVKDNSNLPFNHFDWRLDFPEVLNPDIAGKNVGFDVVIGNPPYVLVQNMNLAENEKNVYNSFEVAQYKTDLFHLFIQRSIDLIKSELGVLSFITPNTFLKNKHNDRLRKYIYDYTFGISFVLFYNQVFEQVSVDNVIFVLSKNRISKILSKIIEIRNNNFENEVKYNYRFYVYNQICSPKFVFNFDISLGNEPVLKKIEKDSWKIKEIGRSYFGIQTFDRDKYVSKEKLTEFHLPVIDGGNIKKYLILKSTDFLDFRKENIKSGGNPEVYKIDRIVVRQIGKHPFGSICNANLYTLNTIYNIFLLQNDVDLKYVLAIINSKITEFYWGNLFYDNKATFPKIKKDALESIRVKKLSIDKQEPFIGLVDKILQAKINSQTADTRDWEDQIDHMAYKLYELTYNEVLVVDPAFALSEQEYNDFSY